MSDPRLSDESSDQGRFDVLISNPDPGRKLWVRCLMQVVWPAFVGSAITVGLLFSLIDPLQIEWVHVHLNDSREASYTLGFLLLWILYTFACGVTWFLAITETPAASYRPTDRPEH
jgi:hypothetical protein